jgi:hypothetical protein
VCASGASGAEERRCGNQRRRDPSPIGADSLSLPHFLPCHIPLLQNSLPVTGSKGPLVTGKAPVTSNMSLVTRLLDARH